MDKYTQGRLSSQVRRVRRCRRQVVQEQDLCFRKLLPQEQVEAALERHHVRYRERLYTPLVTIWTFLYQVLSADQSCRAAVARLLAFWCVAEKDPPEDPQSAKTDPYCKARERLPEKLLADLARERGAELQRQVAPTGLLGGRPLKIADGTTLSMPDTPANQKAYPQQRGQKPGLGFPILRLVGVIGLSSGAVLDVAMGPYRGKQTGETALLRQLLDRLEAGDILLTDAIFANYWMIALLQQHGVDGVSRLEGQRRVDFRQGQRLGRYDHIVSWQKSVRPPWMSQKLYQSLPETLRLREVQVEVSQKGFRCRWHAELDLRSIKHVMQMDVLRCKSPAMVRKEIWMHLLAYNLIRKLMAQAAATAGVCPRDLSFKGTLQTLVAFAAAGWSCPAQRWVFPDGRINRPGSLLTSTTQSP